MHWKHRPSPQQNLIWFLVGWVWFILGFPSFWRTNRSMSFFSPRHTEAARLGRYRAPVSFTVGWTRAWGKMRIWGFQVGGRLAVANRGEMVGAELYIYFRGCILSINLSSQRETGNKINWQMSAASQHKLWFPQQRTPCQLLKYNKLVFFKFACRPYSPVLAQEIAINIFISIILKCFKRLSSPTPKCLFLPEHRLCSFIGSPGQSLSCRHRWVGLGDTHMLKRNNWNTCTRFRGPLSVQQLFYEYVKKWHVKPSTHPEH